MWRDPWAYRRRAVLGAAGALAVLLMVAVITVAVSGGSGGRPDNRATPSSSITRTAAGRLGGAPASPYASGYDRSAWAAVPSVTAAEASTAYPPISDADRTQPEVFAAAFACGLLTRDYRTSSRDELLAWAQSASAPLTIVQVPLSPADRASTLLVSLVTAGWDAGEVGTPAGSPADWLALRARQAYTTVADVRVGVVPDFPPPETTFTLPTFDRLVTATVTLHALVSGGPVDTRESVAFEVVMTGQDGWLGAAEIQHWVTRSLP